MSNEACLTRDDASAPAETVAIHATAVAIGEKGLLIRGASKAGKSTLALALIAASRPDQPIMLIGDDRILLSRAGSAVIAAPHPLIRGMIEKRGLGILRSMPFRPSAPLCGIIDLTTDHAQPAFGSSRSGACDLAGKNFPTFTIVNERRWSAAPRVLEWFAATLAAH